MLELVLIGNLGADAIARANDKGQFCTFDVAHTDKYRDANGAPVEVTTWVSCSYNRPQSVLQYLTRGRQVYVRGRAQVRAYVDKNHEHRAALSCFVDELVLLGGAPAPAPADVEPAPAKKSKAKQPPF